MDIVVFGVIGTAITASNVRDMVYRYYCTPSLVNTLESVHVYPIAVHCNMFSHA